MFPFFSNSNNSAQQPCFILVSRVPAVNPLFDPFIQPKSTSAVPYDSITHIHHSIDDDLLKKVLVEPPDPVVDPIPLRESSRTVKQPSYLQAYHCNQVSFVIATSPSQSGTSHPLSSHLSYQHLSSCYKSFCYSISSLVKPAHYFQAASDPKWQEAMIVEIAALEANQTWTSTLLPASKKPIGCK